MKEMRQDRIAFDLQSSRSYSPEGHLRVKQTNISKANVCPYYGREIPDADKLGLDPNKTYMLLRDPEELAKAVGSFDGVPLVMVHKATSAEDHDHENVCGSVSYPKFGSPYMKADLVVWPGEAIKAIESGEQKELSSAYRYRADMTPGTFDGVKFDGVMRDISANHVALVKEGRAGPDVVVGDSIDGMQSMNTKAQKILDGYFKPRIATGMALDARPCFAGVSKTNFKAKKATIAADMAKRSKPLLAKDADIDDIVELLDKLEEVIPEMEVEKLGSVEGAGPVPDDDEPDATDANDAELRAFLKAKGLSDEDIDKACAMMSAPAAMDSDDETGSAAVVSATSQTNGGSSGMGRDPIVDNDGTNGGSSGSGRDSRLGKDKDMVNKTAMDAALAARDIAFDKKLEAATKAAADKARAEMAAIHNAIDFVRPWVGTFHAGMSFDSAPAVYGAALKAIGKDPKGYHPDALKPILEAQPKPGEQVRSSTPRVAMDAAIKGEYEAMFPDANRLAN